jgi:hypothetical protein
VTALLVGIVTVITDEAVSEWFKPDSDGVGPSDWESTMVFVSERLALAAVENDAVGSSDSDRSTERDSDGTGLVVGVSVGETVNVRDGEVVSDGVIDSLAVGAAESEGVLVPPESDGDRVTLAFAILTEMVVEWLFEIVGLSLPDGSELGVRELEGVSELELDGLSLGVSDNDNDGVCVSDKLR